MSSYLDTLEQAKYMALNYLQDLWLPIQESDEKRVELLDILIKRMRELREHYDAK